MWASLPPDVITYLCGPSGPEGALGWEAAAVKVDEYRTLTDDYDGQGAKAPAADTVAAAEVLVRELRRAGVHSPSWVTPGPNGSVNLDWEFAGGVSVSVEVTDPGEAEVFLLNNGREPGYWVLNQTAAV